MNIDAAKRVPIESVVHSYGLKFRRQGHEFVGPCPACDGTDRFAITTKKQVFNCRGCGARGDVIDLVQHITGCTVGEAVAALMGGARTPRSALPRRPAPKKDDAATSKEAMSLWREAVSPRGTPVIAYLGRRNLVLPHEAPCESIRYHPSCKFGLRYVPCMLALVRNIGTNVPQAIHRTAIDLSGNKVEVDGLSRMSLGPTSGGAIKLTPDEMVSICLGIGEGIESALSMRLVPEFGPSPVWSVLSATGVAKFPILPGIESLWIATDNDDAGQGAAAESSRDWTLAGREVFRLKSKRQGEDLNDLARRASCV